MNCDLFFNYFHWKLDKGKGQNLNCICCKLLQNLRVKTKILSQIFTTFATEK
jgi:hypothetical protein